MKRLVAAFALLLAAQLAQASCWPAQALGTGSAAQVKELRDDTEGTERTALALWWWCPAKFEHRVRVVACATAELSACLSGGVADLAGTTDAAVLDKAWAEKVPLFGAERAWIFEAFLRQGLPLKMPAPPAWAVPRVNATTMTRPSYRVVNGVRERKESGVRAPVATTCECIGLHVEEGSSTYCRFDSQQPDLVALCRPVAS